MYLNYFVTAIRWGYFKPFCLNDKTCARILSQRSIAWCQWLSAVSGAATVLVIKTGKSWLLPDKWCWIDPTHHKPFQAADGIQTESARTGVFLVTHTAWRVTTRNLKPSSLIPNRTKKPNLNRIYWNRVTTKAETEPKSTKDPLRTALICLDLPFKYTNYLFSYYSAYSVKGTVV